MQTKASQIALLFYLVTVLYHPLVIVLHMGSHYAYSWQQEMAHYHHHQLDPADADKTSEVQFHTHGDEDVNEDRHLPLCVFQCLIPVDQGLEGFISEPISTLFSIVTFISVFYPDTQGPPPRELA